MRRCQTSRQHWVSQLQPHLHGIFQRKKQKPHLEIVGSLIFCVGLTFSKPAWSAPEVGSAALSLSNSENQGTVEVTSASTEADIVASPNVLPPGTMEDAVTEWSPPVNRDDTNIRRQSDAVLDTRTGERSDTNSSETLSNLSVSPPSVVPNPPMEHNVLQSSISISLPLDALKDSPSQLALNGRVGEEEKGKEEQRKNLSTQTHELRTLELPPQFSVFPPCSATQQQYSSTPPSLVADAEKVPTPELQPFPTPNENSSPLEQSASGEDPELGKLRLRELAAPPPPSQPAVYLLGGAGYFRSNNIFSGVNSVDDGLFKAGLTLLAVPSIGPETSLFASVGGNIYRYSDLSVYNYDELNFSAGIRQKIGSRTYGELGWNNRQLFSEDGGDRFLDDHSVYLELGRRDVLARQLTLDTFYQFRVSFANPSDRSQIINYLGTSLGYTPIPPLELALGYQFAFSDFTQKERQDTYHQVIASLNYTLTPNSRLYLYGGHSFGNSSDKFTDFEGLVFGAGINWSLPLF
ncbi:MAG: hypothetical protein Fur006_63940 [Coleofasciculaceae cyanobacterium]